MISLEEWMDIISLHWQGFSIKAIARRLGVSRNTPHFAFRRKTAPHNERPTVPSKPDPFKDYGRSDR